MNLGIETHKLYNLVFVNCTYSTVNVTVQLCLEGAQQSTVLFHSFLHTIASSFNILDKTRQETSKHLKDYIGKSSQFYLYRPKSQIFLRAL